MGVALSKFLFLLAIFAFDKVHLAGGGHSETGLEATCFRMPPPHVAGGGHSETGPFTYCSLCPPPRGGGILSSRFTGGGDCSLIAYCGGGDSETLPIYFIMLN